MLKFRAKIVTFHVLGPISPKRAVSGRKTGVEAARGHTAGRCDERKLRAVRTDPVVKVPDRFEPLGPL